MQQNQWGQFPYTQQQQQPSFLNSQPTGYPGAGGLQPMQTGFNPQLQNQGQQQRPQPTAMLGTQTGGNYSFLSQQPPSNFSRNAAPQMAPQMTGYPGGAGSGMLPQQTGFPSSGGPRIMPQQTGFQGGMMSQPTGMGMTPQQTGWQGGSGLMSQPTGMGRLQPQPTGLPHDPRLQSMMQNFLPSNMSQPFAASGAPQFQQAPQPLQQTFQSLLQNPAVNTPKIPWTLSRQEKKDYDQIFRAWDTNGEGFISGEMARGVFGQAGLGQEDLMKIWNLSDVDNRGKLNLPEFHVAMGLIYRALNGNTIPDKLPEELVPASMRDIDSTVSFMKDLLKHESSTRSSASSPGYSTPSAPASKDALLYKHSDDLPSTYKPSSRHLDRKSVRYAGEDPDAGLKDIRRKLENTSSMLEKSTEKSAEDEELEEEIESLQYRVRRIQEDIEYTSKGRRSAEKDEERRKLERELLFLMHEKLPELERRQDRRREEKAMEERAGVRRRDDRNRTAGRYDDRDDRDTYSRYKGTFDRDRSRDRYDRESYDRDHRDRSRDRYDRYDDRDRRDNRDTRDRYERPRSPAPRAPPPAPPPQSSTSTATSAPPPPPAPATSSAAAGTKNMTPEERKAYIREQAQKRISERLRALGVESAPAEQGVDTSVQDRLVAERQEAEEKSHKAEEEQKARDETRKKRFAGAGETEEAPKPASPAPTPGLKSAIKKPAPPAPASRAKNVPAPPPSRAHQAPAAPPAPPAPRAPEPAEDPEEVELRRREEAALKAREERRKRLEQLQKEEEEERLKEEAMLSARRNKSLGVSQASTPQLVSPEPSVVSPPPAPPAPPAPAQAPKEQGSYNPFRKPGGTPSAASGNGGFNPFFKPPAVASPAAEEAPKPIAVASPPPAAPAAPAPPAPPPPPPPAAAQPTQSAPSIRSPPIEPEWEDITEKQADESDSDSDDEYTTSRAGRQGLAQALFGNIMGGGGGSGGSQPTSRPGSAAPKATPKALENIGGGNPEQSRSALLSAIQGGARLKKAQTVDKSGPPAAGKVIGGAAPPPHINDTPQEHSPPASPAPVSEDSYVGNPKRQSVDWYAGLAADSSHPAASVGDASVLEPTKEEQEPDDESGHEGYEQVEKSEGQAEDELEEFDMDTTIRVRSLYQFDGTRDVDLKFKEDVVILAHPSKDESSAWWYGISVKDGLKGWFPKDYVEEIKVTLTKALYEYPAGEADQLPFAEGDTLSVVDSSDNDWWKVEHSGVIFLVPAAYLEVIQGGDADRVEENVPGVVLVEEIDESASGPPDVEVIPTQEPSLEDTNKLPREVLKTDSRSRSNSIPAPLRNRPRATSTLSVASTTVPRSPSFISEVDEGESSSDDSVLSWWSDSDDESSESENGNEDEDNDVHPTSVLTGNDESHKATKERRAAPQPPKVEDPDKEVERKRREAQRQSILAATGLQLRREPPGVPDRVGRVSSRHRPAPAVPGGKNRRHAPAAPGRNEKVLPQMPKEEERTERLGVQDAYARYEAFLSQPRPEPSRADSRPTSQVLSPQVTGPAALSPASTTVSLPTSLTLGKETGGRISGFFKSMRAHPERKTPTISAPTITRIDEPSSRPQSGIFGAESGEGETISDFGKTWSSLVEPSVVETMDSMERKRQEAIFEFISTESTYNRDLQLIVEVFYSSLLPMLDEKALAVIFANIEDILLFNIGFLSALEERQKAARLYIVRIGDVLCTLREAGLYSTYCINQHLAIKLLQSLRDERPQLNTRLQNIRETNSSTRGLDLSHFLLIPMQRICRYPLLIKQIIHYTPSDSPDQPLLQDALHAVEVIVSQINEGVREAEGEERLRALSESLWIGGEGRLDLTAPTAFMGPRRLIKEGHVSKAKSGRKLDMILCNDIVVLLDGTDLYRMPLALHEVEIKQTRDAVGFALKADQKRGGDTITLKATSAHDAKDWMKKIDKAQKIASASRRRGL